MNVYDILYGLGLFSAAPLWLVVPKARRKVLRALRERMGHEGPRAGSGEAVLIHAVSLGEINATRAMVAGLGRARPDLSFVVSTTTDTGYARARELYGTDPRVALIRYPLDFSAAIGRMLANQRPAVVVLMELEVWPNFLLACRRAGIPALVVNGRLTDESYRRYRLAKPLLARTFRRLAVVCAQEEAYAERFRQLGVPPERVRVTGTMKFDTAQVAERIDGAESLAQAVGLRPGREPVWVCGSTGPGEEDIILRHYRRLLAAHPTLRLVIVPRHPQRFDEAAKLIEAAGFSVFRRSLSPPLPLSPSPSVPPVILGDTMGELRKFYSLADVVLVGRTLVDLGPRQRGSDMIEPAALAKPVVVGPWTQNFAEPMNCFRAAHAMKVVADEQSLGDTIAALLSSPDNSAAMGRRAQEVVKREQGATGRNVEVILAHLPQPTGRGQSP
jgi:3-deoxy-D-manno-octulosonic-acid transferase